MLFKLFLKVYRNPFSYGKLNNWKVFFGVEKRRWNYTFYLLFMVVCSLLSYGLMQII